MEPTTAPARHALLPGTRSSIDNVAAVRALDPWTARACTHRVDLPLRAAVCVECG